MQARNATIASLSLLVAVPALADEFLVELVGASFRYAGQSNQSIDLTIHPGDSVRWVWVSGMHNVVSGNHGDPDEGSLFLSGSPVGAPHEFTHEFSDTGDFPYHCELHHGQGMVSTVKVRCQGDFNGDMTVNALDVLAFLNAWNDGDPRADWNHDGSFNALDVLAFLNSWNGPC